jgi:phospholipid/cholesterol/gamma-HCH transport system substrate-binding protein
MYSQRTNYITVGLFVTAMLSATVIWLTMLTGGTGPRDTYVLMFENVADVKFGTQVRYEGFPIGEVEAISPQADGARMSFRVKISIARDWLIPRDSVARITASSFLAAKTIDITSGDSPEVIAAGGEIATEAAGDMFAVMATAASEITELNRTSIRPLLATLNDLAGTLANGAPRITKDLTSVTHRMDSSLAALQDILASENIQAIRRVIQNFETTSDTIAGSSDDLAETLRRADNLMRNLDELVEENRGNLDQSLKDIQYTLRSMTQTVDSIVYNLDGAARNMNEFSRLIRQNPGLLLGGSPREAVSPATVSGNTASTGEGIQ